MQIANCTLLLNEFKASVPKNLVTPAEVMLLIHMHHENAGGMPIQKLAIAKEPITRDDQSERKRLAEFYKPFSTDPKAITIEKVFPKGQKLPQTFEEVTDVEGNKVFSKGGETHSVPVKTKVGDKEYTHDELLALVAKANAVPPATK